MMMGRFFLFLFSHLRKVLFVFSVLLGLCWG